MLNITELLVAFLEDYTIAERTDLYGEKSGGYELITGKSVGGNMHSLCYDYIMNTVGRHVIEKALFQMKDIEAQYYDETHPLNWMKIDDLHDYLTIERQRIAKEIVKGLK